jgi:hypothetical protein
LSFAKEASSLKVQGKVRWQGKYGGHTGVSFGYLDPGCRDWVIAAIADGSCRSYVPQCRNCS